MKAKKRSIFLHGIGMFLIGVWVGIFLSESIKSLEVYGMVISWVFLIIGIALVLAGIKK
jgi:hypothetical protein